MVVMLKLRLNCHLKDLANKLGVLNGITLGYDLLLSGLIEKTMHAKLF